MLYRGETPERTNARTNAYRHPLLPPFGAPSFSFLFVHIIVIVVRRHHPDTTAYNITGQPQETTTGQPQAQQDNTNASGNGGLTLATTREHLIPRARILVSRLGAGWPSATKLALLLVQGPLWGHIYCP